MGDFNINLLDHNNSAAVNFFINYNKCYVDDNDNNIVCRCPLLAVRLLLPWHCCCWWWPSTLTEPSWPGDGLSNPVRRGSRYDNKNVVLIHPRNWSYVTCLSKALLNKLCYSICFVGYIAVQLFCCCVYAVHVLVVSVGSMQDCVCVLRVELHVCVHAVSVGGKQDCVCAACWVACVRACSVGGRQAGLCVCCVLSCLCACMQCRWEASRTVCVLRV